MAVTLVGQACKPDLRLFLEAEVSIKFVCRCGKHLRARDEMASRRSRCPRCGAPVGIPPLRPTHQGATLGPISLVERQSTRAALSIGLAFPGVARPAEAIDPLSLDPASVQVISSGRDLSGQSKRSPRHEQKPAPGSRLDWRHRRWMETHWYQCLLLPRGAWPLVLGLAFLLTVFSGGLAIALPILVRDLQAGGSWLQWLCLPCLSIPLLVFGYGSGFLDGVFASAKAGEVGTVRWPGRNIVLALQSGARWLLCFLAGPAAPAGLSILYWIHSGELGLLDWLIVAELNLVAISGWFLLLLALSDRGRLRDLNPVRIIELIQRLGHRLVALAVFAAAAALAHAWLASAALDKLHHDEGVGWLWLFLSWTSGLFFATFLFRWVGVWFYWDFVRAKLSESRLIGSS